MSFSLLQPSPRGTGVLKEALSKGAAIGIAPMPKASGRARTAPPGRAHVYVHPPRRSVRAPWMAVGLSAPFAFILV